MATFTVTGSSIKGNMRSVAGTFTTSEGDTSVVLDTSTHGLNYIEDYDLTLHAGAVGVQTPKVSVSSGTITATYDNTRGYSGRFYVCGR